MGKKIVSRKEQESIADVEGSAAGAKPPGVRKVEASDELMKVKVILKLPQSHPLATFLAEVKQRGCKGFDTADFVVQSLDQVVEDWWEKQLEEFTPLEYKVRQALSDPSLREKLSNLLSDAP